MYGFYRVKKNRLLTGVLAGLADKFQWDIWLVRGIFLTISIFTKAGLLAVAFYIVGSIFLPIKEDMDAERYGTGPRKRKDAEKIDDGGFF